MTKSEAIEEIKLRGYHKVNPESIISLEETIIESKQTADYTKWTYERDYKGVIRLIYNAPEGQGGKLIYNVGKWAEIIDTPEMVTKENVYVGARVVRGRDWEWGRQDCFKGKQQVGTVINDDYLWVRVKWDNIILTNRYGIGGNDKYDLYFANEDNYTEEI